MPENQNSQLDQVKAPSNFLPASEWQTKARGDNDAEYQIYKASAESLGWPLKTYSQWLSS